MSARSSPLRSPSGCGLSIEDCYILSRTTFRRFIRGVYLCALGRVRSGFVGARHVDCSALYLLRFGNGAGAVSSSD